MARRGTERSATEAEVRDAESFAAASVLGGGWLGRFERPADRWSDEDYLLVQCTAGSGVYVVADWYGGQANEALAYGDVVEAAVEFGRRRQVEADEHGIDLFEVLAGQLRAELDVLLAAAAERMIVVP